MSNIEKTARRLTTPVWLGLTFVLTLGVLTAFAAGVSEQTPPEGSVVAGDTDVHAFVSPDVDPSSIVLKIDGVSVDASITAEGWLFGIFGYNVGYTAAGLDPGRHTVSVEYTDNTGRDGSSTWWFDSEGGPPYFEEKRPRGIVSDATPTVSARVTEWPGDPGSVDATVTVDAVASAATVTAVDTTTLDVSCDVATPLADGSHDVTMTCLEAGVASAGTTWTFEVETPNRGPRVTDVAPSDGVSVTGYFTFSAWVEDGDGIDAGSRSLTFDMPGGGSKTVTPSIQFGQGTGRTRGSVSRAMSDPYDGSRVLTFTVADEKGASTTVTRTVQQSFDAPRSWGRAPVNSLYGFPVADQYPRIRSIMEDEGSYIDGSTARMWVNDVEVTPTVVEYPSNPARTSIEYTPTDPLPEGQATVVRVTCCDNAGNFGQDQWSFDVAVRPQITQKSPAPSSVVVSEDTTALLGFRGYDASGIASFNLTLMDWQYNAMPVSPVATYSNGGKDVDVAAVIGPLARGQYHVILNVTDGAGVGTFPIMWDFSVELPVGLPLMDDTGNEACETCHVATDDVAAFNELHLVEKWGTGHPNTCVYCHTSISNPSLGCQVRCHGGTTSVSHGTAMGWSWGGKTTPTYPIGAPRIPLDCMYCHQSKSGDAQIEKSAAEWGVAHDLVNDHRIGLDQGCRGSECHSDSLTLEHARPGRTDSAGQPVACTGCHGSEDATVAAAMPPRYPALRVLTPYPTNVTSDEYSIPGKSIVGAKLSPRARGTFIIHAYYDGAWHSVATPTASVVDESPHVFTFPAASKVKLEVRPRSDNGWPPDYAGSWGAAGLDHFLVSPADPEPTCYDCHPDWHPGHDVDLSADGCDLCHAQDLITEHVEARGRTCDDCHEGDAPDVEDAIAGRDKACDACHDPEYHGDHFAEASWGTCDDCHELDLMAEHEPFQGCETCHTAPDAASPLAEPWDQGCQQGSCHPDEPHEDPTPDPCAVCHVAP